MQYERNFITMRDHLKKNLHLEKRFLENRQKYLDSRQKNRDKRPDSGKKRMNAIVDKESDSNQENEFETDI